MSISDGFVKGQTDNLPKLDAMTMFSFFKKNPDFTGAEIRGAKAQRSGRESYGDNAVGYVQVKRENDLCTVKAIVTPEHRVSKKGYDVTIICNEEEEEVVSAQCDSCAASLGGCKHAIALLMWLHRRSEEPSVTEVTCYWKKSKLSTVGKSLKFMKAKDFGKAQVSDLPPKQGSFLSNVLSMSNKRKRTDATMTKYFKDAAFANLSLHHLILHFFQSLDSAGNASDFLEFCSAKMSECECEEAVKETIMQNKCKLWHELRYGRITASRAYESAHCHTMDGCLVECILGASKMKGTYAMKRGIQLEKEVRAVVEKKIGIKIQQCGFYTSPDCPVMGASPDGISEEYVLEIKCPSTQKRVNDYLVNGEITNKYRAQIQLQMYFAKKQKGLFCVANYDFETSKEVHILPITFDDKYCKDIIQKCINFWKAAIYPMLENCK